MSTGDAWPPLPLAAWKPTYRTLHMWTQMAGKVQLALTPRTNHWWNVALHVTARGLATTPMPHGADVFTVTFDFVDQALRIDLSRGERREIPLAPQPVANFYERFMATLRALGIEVRIWPMPVEVPDPVRFDRDSLGDYDGEAARRCWRILFEADAVFKEFRARFIGKCSPVHFFWGSFDLAVTRFSGRPAPVRPGADSITREAYSHECNSAGWWPGSGAIDGPAFYAYAAPEPEGLSAAPIGPAGAFYSPEMKEFIYRYDDMRAAPDPRAALLEFLQTTYEAGANLAGWDRAALERAPSPPPRKEQPDGQQWSL
jgi:uncharacterized protein DUF5996